MKTYILVPILLFVASCNGNEERQKKRTDDALKVATEISTNESTTKCFLRATGDKNEDSTMLRLVTKGNSISGDLYHMPYEKDARIGTLSGEKDGEEMEALWSYTQEGMNDTLRVAFKLKGNSVFQKPNVFNPKRGREVLPDNVDYEMEYKEMDCAEFRERK